MAKCEEKTVDKNYEIKLEEVYSDTKDNLGHANVARACTKAHAGK